MVFISYVSLNTYLVPQLHVWFLCFPNRQYFTIASQDQRLQYKQDFNTEYEEYRQLHEKIDSVAKKFLQLQILRKETPRDSLEFEVLVIIREIWWL